jgi:hypothetical protein
VESEEKRGSRSTSLVIATHPPLDLREAICGIRRKEEEYEFFSCRHYPSTVGLERGYMCNQQKKGVGVLLLSIATHPLLDSSKRRLHVQSAAKKGNMILLLSRNAVPVVFQTCDNMVSGMAASLSVAKDP